MNSNFNRIIDISYTAPELPYPMVSRPHLIQTLVQIFDSNTEIVCVEGKAGHGKTTLLREFAEARTVKGHCFGVFLKAASSLSYDPVLARFDMANQVHWFLESEPLPDDSEPTDGYLRTLWGKCAHSLNRERTQGYIIVDGIHHIPPEEQSIKQAIMDLLPFGVRPFRFLFSGDIENDLFFDNKKLRVKPFPISTFASQETDEYLQDLIKDKKIRSDYHAAFGGVPLLLASVRRLLTNPANPQKEIDINSLKNIKSLFEAELNLAGSFSDEVKKVLGFIIAYGHPVDSQTLSKKCSIDETEIKKLLDSFPFLTFSRKAHGWEFASELFRDFAEKKLYKSVNSATEDIASSLLENPDSDDSLTRLPLYLEKTGNTEKLVKWLDENRLAEMLLKNRTAARIEPALRKAITICHNQKNDRALASYSVLLSIIRQISQTTGIEHEIRARAALGDFDGALAVANNAPLFTQRLRLLAVLAASFSGSPGSQVQPLIEQIRELLKQVDINDLPNEEAIDIVTDLYPVDAKLALNLLRKITQSDIEDSSFEVAIARTRLAAIQSEATGEKSEGQSANNPVSKDLIVDRKLRRLLEESRMFYDAKSASEVLEATKSIEDPSERFFIQRKWISQHPFRDDVLDMVENAINDAITVSRFTPNATFYREISTPLPYSKEKERRGKLVAILDGQKSIIESKGPTVDYVRLQIRLAECDYVDEELSRAASRLEDLYLDSVESVDELETQITCLAWFVAELHKFDPSGKMSNYTDVKELVDDELEKTLTEILRNSANQFEILSGALEALAVHIPKAALEMSRKLNTIERRNAAFLHIVIAMCDSSTTPPDNTLLFEITDEMEEGLELDYSIKKITERLCQDIKNGAEQVTVLGEEFFCRLDKCSSAATRAECLGILATTVEPHSGSEVLRASIDQKLLAEFEFITSPREKYQIACRLIAALRATCPVLAEKIFKYLIDPDRRTTSESAEVGLFYMLDLLTKAACALSKSKLLADKDVQKICGMIKRVRDPHLKVNLFSRLAFFLWPQEQNSFFSDIVNQQIWPELSKLTGKDHAPTHWAWTKAYPVVWLEDRDRARRGIATFPPEVRNECISALSLALLRKQPPGEPFDDDSHKTKFPLNYSEIQNLLHLCEETDEDFMIFTVFESIASKVTSKQSSATLTRNQKAEIARRMLEISETKLPMKRRIQHTGFQILCKAQALRIFPLPTPKWGDLIREGEALSNAADRIYVLAHIASCLPSKNKRKGEQLLKTAEETADNLKTMEDKHGCYYMIAMLSAEKNKEQASHLLKKAFGTITQTSSRRNAIRENLIVDLAQRLDPDLPTQLAVLYDDDPARERYKKRAQKQMDIVQLKKDIGDVKSSIDLQKRQDGSELGSAAWHALGALNSGRMFPVDMVRLRNMLACASNYPLIESYPMYSWVLSNTMLKYSGTPQSTKYIRNMFEGMLQSAEFLFLITDADERLSSYPEWQDLGDNENQVVVQVGERDKGLNFIRDWLQKNTEEHVTIVDPYFGVEDLELVLQVVETDPYLKVRILTSKAAQRKINGQLSDAYSSAWRHICDHPPPDTEIYIIGSRKTGDAPFHDRWILSKSTGLRLGTSFNSLGNKDSEISVLGSEEVAQVHHTVNRYYAKQVKEFNGDGVAYESFELLPF